MEDVAIPYVFRYLDAEIATMKIKITRDDIVVRIRRTVPSTRHQLGGIGQFFKLVFIGLVCLTHQFSESQAE